MNAIHQWFEKQQNRSKHFVSIYDMIFGEEKAAYIYFRLRFFNLQLFFRFFLHAAIFYLLYSYLPHKSFNVVIAASALKTLINAGWWGALETMRTQNRYAYRCSKREEIDKNIGFWLALSFLLSGLLLTAGISAMGMFYPEDFTHLLQGDGEGRIEALYLAGLILTLGIQIPVHTLHSGIYAITRIMRPAYSMILADLLGLGILFLFWPLIDVIAIPLAITLKGVFSACLTLYYTQAMYNVRGFIPEKLNPRQFVNRFLEIPWKDTFISAAANLLMTTDGILIVMLSIALLGNPEMLPVFYMVFLITPFMRAASDWARLFYFDRKRLEDDALTNFIKEYDRYLEKAALAAGFFFWLASCFFSYVLISSTALASAFILLPFFLLRSHIANREMRCFTHYHYFDVMVSSLLLTGSLVGIYLLDIPTTFKFLLVALVMIGVNAYLKHFRLPRFNQIKIIKPYLSLYAWLTSLNQAPYPVNVYGIKFHREAKKNQRDYLIRKMAACSGDESAQICLADHQTIHIFTKHHESNPIPTLVQIAQFGAGLIEKAEHYVVGEARAGEQQQARMASIERCPIVSAIMQKAGLSPLLKEERQRDHLQEGIERFTQLFSEGICYHPIRKMGTNAEPLSQETIRSFGVLINQNLYGHCKEQSSEIDLSLLFLSPVIHAIFIIPKKVYREEDIQKWRAYLHALNIEAALGMIGDQLTN